LIDEADEEAGSKGEEYEYQLRLGKNVAFYLGEWWHDRWGMRREL